MSVETIKDLIRKNDRLGRLMGIELVEVGECEVPRPPIHREHDRCGALEGLGIVGPAALDHDLEATLRLGECVTDQQSAGPASWGCQARQPGFSRRPLLTFGGDHKPAGEVGEQADPTEEGGGHEAKPYEPGCGVGTFGDGGCNAGQDSSRRRSFHSRAGRRPA